MLTKYPRFIKGFVKAINQRGFLIFDESDEITNYNSERSHAVRNVFRKLPYKLLTTGTTTRNNIAEIYGQGLRFPARGGWNLFKSCYAPVKSMVFGIKKHNQDVFNAESLEELLKRSVITRKFKEIALFYYNHPHSRKKVLYNCPKLFPCGTINNT